MELELLAKRKNHKPCTKGLLRSHGSEIPGEATQSRPASAVSNRLPLAFLSRVPFKYFHGVKKWRQSNYRLTSNDAHHNILSDIMTYYFDQGCHLLIVLLAFYLERLLYLAFYLVLYYDIQFGIPAGIPSDIAIWCKHPPPCGGDMRWRPGTPTESTAGSSGEGGRRGAVGSILKLNNPHLAGGEERICWHSRCFSNPPAVLPLMSHRLIDPGLLQ